MASPQKGGINGREVSGMGRGNSSKVSASIAEGGAAKFPARSGTAPAQKGDTVVKTMKPGKTSASKMRTGPSRY